MTSCDWLFILRDKAMVVLPEQFFSLLPLSRSPVSVLPYRAYFVRDIALDTEIVYLPDTVRVRTALCLVSPVVFCLIAQVLSVYSSTLLTV